jgi:hypothetical protein
MEVIVLDSVPFEVNTENVLRKMHTTTDSPYSESIAKLVAEAAAVGNPKAVYKPAYIEAKGEDFVIVDGIRFTSRVLRVNLDEIDRVFPYVITCGRELEDLFHPIKDIFDSYCADVIKEMVLVSARQKVKSQIDRQYGLQHTSYMSPGSLEDWPITEQIPLFQLLGDVKEYIGVELTESCLMLPVKSVSGVYFPQEGTFESCQLCSREKCPNRRTAYDKDLYEQKYKLK